MSNSDDKKDSKTGARKPPGSKPVKTGRKRQASRPPTINVEAVRLDSETVDGTGPQNSAKDQPKSADKAGVKPEDAPISNTGRFGFRALALSAGIGAAAAIVLFAGIFGVTFFSSDQQVLEDRISSLSTRIEDLNTLAESSQAVQVNGTAIKGLKTQLEELASRPADVRIGKIAERLKSIEAIAAKPQKPPVEAAQLKKLSDILSAQGAQIERNKANTEISIRQAAFLEEAIKSAGETIKGSTDGTEGSLVAQNLRLAGFEAQLTRLQESLKNIKSTAANNPGLADLEKTVNGLLNDIANVKNTNAALDGRIAETLAAMATSRATTVKFDQRLARLEQTDKSGDFTRLAALSYAIEGLVQKIESGGTFERELGIVAAAVPQNKELAELTDQARTGVKSLAQLQRDFAPVLRAVLAVDDTQATSGMVGKLVGTAKSLIQIRRVGEIEGEGREAVIARMEARVKAGDLTAALVAAKKLEGASAQAAQSWIQAVEQRVMTIELVNKIRNDVIADLGLSDTGSAVKE